MKVYRVLIHCGFTIADVEAVKVTEKSVWLATSGSPRRVGRVCQYERYFDSMEMAVFYGRKCLLTEVSRLKSSLAAAEKRLSEFEQSYSDYLSI